MTPLEFITNQLQPDIYSIRKYAMYMTSSNGVLMSWYQKGNALVKEINLIITGSNVITILFSISHVYIKKLIKNCKNYVGAI